MKTQEQFEKEVYEALGEDYKVVGKYKGTDYRVEIKHLTCGNVNNIFASLAINGNRCGHCFGRRANKRTTEQYKQEVKDLVGDEYKVVGKYKNSGTPIKTVHNKCGTTFYPRPNGFLRGTRCPECAKLKKTKTHRQFIKEVKDLEGDEYSVRGKYKNNATKIKMEHVECGHIYKVSPIQFLQGNRCPECYGVKKLNTGIFKERVFELENDKYEVVGEYVTTDTEIEMYHKECGRTYTTKPRHFLWGSRCIHCNSTTLKTQEEFNKEVEELVGREYKVVGKYVNTKTKIELKHEECGNIYKVMPQNFLKGKRCPYCKGSRGEKNIHRYLKRNRINFIEEYKFEDLMYKNPLRFDFYLPDYNVCIEYDGEHHFYPIEYFGGQERYKRQVRNDRMKNEYCNKNKIGLLRIPYTELGNEGKIIEQFLEDKRSGLHVIKDDRNNYPELQ